MLKRPLGRFWAYLCYNLFDHGFLRVWWTNLHEIAPGVWRSNQPGPKRMHRYAEMGIKEVLMLRGEGPKSHLRLEQEAAAEAGIRLRILKLSARGAAKKSRFKELFDAFEEAEKPFLMHCKSGADRAGLASALYLLWSGESIEKARRMLDWRYFHLKSTATGILDVMLDQYEEDLAEGPIDIETWIATKYDRARLTQEFEAGRRHGKPYP